MSLFGRSTAYICAIMHIMAGIGAIFLLRDGSEAIPDIHHRVAYMTQFPDRWRLGWFLCLRL